MSNELKPCPKCKENGAPTRRVNDAGKYCVECVECYEARTPWFDDQRIAEGYWMAISDDATLNLLKITELKDSEASLIERLNEQRRYTEQAVAEVDRLRSDNAELNKKLEATVEALEVIKSYGNCFGYRIGDQNPYAKVVGALKKYRGE